MQNLSTKQTTVIKIDHAQTRSFLLSFLPEDTDGCAHTFQVFQDAEVDEHGKKTRGSRKAGTFHGDYKDLEQQFIQANKRYAGVYFTPNQTDGSGNRQTNNMVMPRAVWAECDDGVPNPDDPYDGWALPPTYVVQSSPGKYHVYWLLETINGSKCEIEWDEWDRVNRGIAQRYNADENAIDRTRVLRVPNFMNMKTKEGRIPCKTELLKGPDGELQYYTWEEITKAFPPLPKQTRKPKPKSEAKSGKKRTAKIEEVREALTYIGSEDETLWVKIGLAIYREFDGSAAGYDLFHEWSATSKAGNYDEEACEKKWERFAKDADNEPTGKGPVTIRTVFHLAKENGYVHPSQKGPYADWDEDALGEVLDDEFFESVIKHYPKPVKLNLTNGSSKDAAPVGDAVDDAELKTEMDAQTETEMADSDRQIAAEEAEREKKFSKMTAVDIGIELINKQTGFIEQPEDLKILVEAMNKDHAFVQSGSKALYVFHTLDPDGRPVTEYMQVSDMEQRYRSIQVRLVREGAKPFYGNAFTYWANHFKRRNYDGMGLYLPDNKTPPKTFNLFQGFGVDPYRGDDKEDRCKKLLKHIRTKICRANDEHYKALMNWCAMLVQKPSKKPGYCVVLHSKEKGTGKSLLMRTLSDIWGLHGTVLSRGQQVTGRFNGHLQQTVFLGLDEAVWGGDKPSKGVLKNLITEDSLTYERKGVDAIAGKNYTHLMLSSNEDWVVPADVHERRFFVLDVLHGYADEHEQKDYFDPIWKERDEEGGLQAFFGVLLDWEIDKEFNPYQPPVTDALNKQKRQGMSGVENFMIDLIESKALDLQSGPIALQAYEKTKVPKNECFDFAKTYCRPNEVPSLKRDLGVLLAKLGANVEAKMPSDKEGSRPRAYELPPLQDLVKKANDYFQGTVVFEEIGDIYVEEDEEGRTETVKPNTKKGG